MHKIAATVNLGEVIVLKGEAHRVTGKVNYLTAFVGRTVEFYFGAGAAPVTLHETTLVTVFDSEEEAAAHLASGADEGHCGLGTAHSAHDACDGSNARMRAQAVHA